MNASERAKIHTKEHYKTLKLYFPKEKYPLLEARAKATGHKKVGTYIQQLIDADLHADEQAATVNQTPDTGDQIPGIKVAAR